MKITIVFCALATFTAAVPTYLQSHEEQTSTIDNVAHNLKREKKSLLRDAVSAMSHEAEIMDKSTSDNTNSRPRMSFVEARSLGIKKPIIIKKKIGYHLYRDSDEEMAHADPHENCRKQVKVKLCDDGSKNMLNCFTSERFPEHITDKDIEHSIVTAKEAVENLQRGLQKMEHTSRKMIADKDLETDLEVHENIEAARVALEHVQQNFGKIETLKLSDNNPKIKEVPVLKSTDEERLSHWKEAIDKVQKKTEIGKNMEDAFKSESLHEKLFKNNEFPKMRDSEDSNTNENGQFLARDPELHTSFGSELLADNEDLSNKQREEVDFDMFTSPTETKHKLHSDSLISETFPTHRDHDTESSNTQKATEHTLTMKDSQASHDIELETKKKVTCNEAHDHEHEEKAVSDSSLSPEKHDKHEKFTALKTEKSNILEPSTTTAMDHEDMELKMKEKSSQKVEFNDISADHSDLKDKSASNSELDTSEIPQKSSNLEVGQISDELKKLRSSLDNQQTFENLMKKQQDNQDPHEHVNHHQNTNENLMKNAISANGNEANFQDPMIHPNMKMANEHNIQPELTETNNLQNHWSMRLAESKHHDDSISQPSDDEPSNGHVSSSKTIDVQNKPHNLNKQESIRTSQNIGHHDIQNPSLMGLNQEEHLSQDFFTDLRNAPNHVKGIGLNEHQLFKENTNMRWDQDHNTDHHLSELHELHDPLAMKWAQAKQQNRHFPHLATASRFNEEHHHDHIFEEMNEKQRQNMWAHARDHSDLMMRLVQEKQLKDQSKLSSELQNDHMHEFLSLNRFPNNFEVTDMHDFPQQFQTSHGHTNLMKHAHTSDMDSAMQPSMIMSLRDSNGNPALEHNDMNWNHHHHSMARYGSSLPAPVMNPGAVGVFPNANTGCGIPLMLSCSPSVVSGSLAKAHPTPMSPPAYRSGDDLMFYMKRDAQNTNETPFPNTPKTSPYNHKSNMIVKSQ